MQVVSRRKVKYRVNLVSPSILTKTFTFLLATLKDYTATKKNIVEKGKAVYAYKLWENAHHIPHIVFEIQTFKKCKSHTALCVYAYKLCKMFTK